MIDKFEDEHFFLSNFSPSIIPMTLTGEEIDAPTIEHAYQAWKSEDPAHQERTLRAPTPNAAKKLGQPAAFRKYGVKLRPDWEQIKDIIMGDLLMWKFSDLTLQAKLIATHPQELVEGNWWGDTYWGVCKGKGKNMLGILLMQVREFYL